MTNIILFIQLGIPPPLDRDMYDELCETRRLVVALQARLDEQEARQADQEKQLKASNARLQFVWKGVMKQDLDLDDKANKYFAQASASERITISGLARPLIPSENGLIVSFPGIPTWSTYVNLPEYLLGLLATTSINDGQFTVHLQKPATLYLLRSVFGWTEVDLNGWSFQETGPFLSFGQMHVYKKAFLQGQYTLSNFSALYLFDVSIL